MKFAKFLRTAILKNICECLPLNFILKETPIQMFPGEFCELFKDISFVEHLRKSDLETPV